jgi:hypothetical protein
MRLLRRYGLLVAAGMLLSALSTGLFAQDADSGKQHDKAAATTMTGCLSKDASGNFVLTDETTGTKTVVTGVSSLEKHSANHKVTLTGASKMDASGKPVFEATKLQHVATTCKSPSQ